MEGKRLSLTRSILTAAICLLVCLQGQTPQSIQIRLVDEAGVPLSNATLEIVTPEGDHRSFTAAADGSVTLTRISPGRYWMRVLLPGFKPPVREVEVQTRAANHLAIDGQDATSRIPEIRFNMGMAVVPEGGLPPPPPPPPRPGPPADLPEIRTFQNPVWNVWQERVGSKVTFDPLPKLLTNRVYTLVVDLSALQYSNAPGTYSRKAIDSFDEWLRENTRDEVVLGALAIPDESFFRGQRESERFKQLVLDLGRMRRLRERGFALNRHPFEELKRHVDSELSFGRVSFRIETKDKTGVGSFALSIWADGERGEFPVDELSIPICIVNSEEANCPASIPNAYSLRGPDSFRAALQTRESGKYPEAALHIVELDSQTVIGVFRCNNCPDWKQKDFQTWRISDTPAELSQYLSGTLISAFEKAAASEDLDSFRYTGEALYRKLFVQGSDADTAFRAFVKSNASRADPASIFIRILPHGPNPLFLAPLGLLAIPDGPKSEFLGLQFEISAPLEIQDYAAAPCISNWVSLAPPDDPGQIEMQNARTELADVMYTLKGPNVRSEVFEDIRQFGDWLAPASSSAVNTPSTALLIVSHHDQNKLFFNKETENPFILSANINRNFVGPSVAIVNACGTAKAGAHDFVRQLNRRGVSAVIATSTEVNSAMSGRFLKLLIDTLRDHPEYSLSRAKLEVVRHLAGKSDGPRVLIYSLIGNGNLKLCPAPRSGN